LQYCGDMVLYLLDFKGRHVMKWSEL
jgi:hypothetical protein